MRQNFSSLAWAGGIIIGAGNTFFAQGFSGGDGNTWNSNNLKWEQICINGLMGGVTTFLGGQIAGKISLCTMVHIYHIIMNIWQELLSCYT